MSPSALALVGFASWTVLLLMTIGGMRAVLTLTGHRPANSFAPDGADISPFSHRLCRAHANCYENLPIFGAFVVVAIITGNAAVTNPLAPVFLAARLGQSITHLISTSVHAVVIRFAFFTIQVVIYIWWAYRLLSIGLRV